MVLHAEALWHSGYLEDSLWIPVDSFCLISAHPNCSYPLSEPHCVKVRSRVQSARPVALKPPPALQERSAGKRATSASLATWTATDSRGRHFRRHLIEMTKVGLSNRLQSDPVIQAPRIVFNLPAPQGGTARLAVQPTPSAIIAVALVLLAFGVAVRHLLRGVQEDLPSSQVKLAIATGFAPTENCLIYKLVVAQGICWVFAGVPSGTVMFSC